MSEDILVQLDRLQRYAAGMQGLLAQAQAQAPSTATGEDSTGHVRVRIGPDGLPDSIVVDEGWREAVRGGLDGAVQEAATSAMGARMTAWTQALDQDGWQRRAERLREGADDEPAAPAPPAPPLPAGEPTRSLSQLTEDVLQTMQNRDSIEGAPALSAQGRGSSGPGGVQITLSAAGLQSCQVPPGWAANRGAAEISTAFASALAAARAELLAATAAAEESGPTAGLDGMLADAMAMLADPGRHVTRRGERR